MRFDEHYLKESFLPTDLLIGSKNNQTIYRADDIDEDEYEMMSKIMEKERNKIPQMEKSLQNGWITNDTKKEMLALHGLKKKIKEWDDKIKPWMIEVLKSKGVK